MRLGFGIFVEARLSELLEYGKVESQVIAPVPWFPFGNQRFGEYPRHAPTPPEEVRHGILFKAGNRDTSISILLSLLNDQWIWPELIADGRAFVETVRNWRNSVANHRASYHRLIGKSD